MPSGPVGHRPALPSVVACRAILRRFVLPMAAQASSHIVLDQALRRSGVVHIAVAGCAIYSGACVRRMLEFHQGIRWKPINSLPGYLPPAVGKGRQLLDFRLTDCNLRVTQHAFPNRGDSGRRADIGRTVTIEALQSDIDMLLMGIRNRLVRRECSGAQDQDAEHRSCALRSLQWTHPIPQELPENAVLWEPA